MANEAGAGCASRGASVADHTFVSEGAPASQGGSCNKLEVYAYSTVPDAGAKFAFFTASGNDLTTVAGTITPVTIPDFDGNDCATFTAPGDFTAFSVSSGDYLGIYTSTAKQQYLLSTGSGIWYKAGDNTNVSGVAFTFDADGIDSLSADIVAAPPSAKPWWYYEMMRRQ